MTTLYISYKNVLRTLISGCLLCSGMAYGQNNSDEVLNLIEQNNTQIIAAQKTLSATIMDNKTGLNLKNPEVEFEHKWNTRNPGEKGKEVSVTQELEWSVISGQKKQLARTKNELAEISFRQTRNAVLLEAQKKLIEISFCNRMIQELNTQLTDADSLVSIYETLLRNGSGNVLDVNRSKLNRAAIATEIRNTNAQKEVLLQDLYGLNGGNTVSLSPEWSLSPLSLPENFDSWFQQMEASVPELNYYQKDLELKKKSVRATKSEMIPSLSVGYTGEFTETERMQGFAIGMSIPLWENKNKVKKSKLDVEAAQSTASDARQRVYNNLKAQYVQSVELKKSLQMQQEALGNLNTIPLMKEALLKGEINLMDYLNEMTRYYDFRKNLLQTEKDYQTALADLHAFEL